MKQGEFNRRVVVAICFWCVSSVAAWADATAPAFAGKTMTLIAHVAAGGGFDTYTRLVARHIGKHIPGEPHVIVQNMPGGGGLRALTYLAKVAPQDGTVVLLITPGLILREVTEPADKMPVSHRDLKWVGNLTQANQVFVTSPRSEIKNLEQARQKVVRTGSSGVASAATQLPWSYNALLGTKFQVIMGYGGSADWDLAIERGELDGRNVTSFASYMAGLPEAERSKFSLLVQLGMHKDPAVPDYVPLVLDLVKGDAQKEPIGRFLSLMFSSINRPFATGPRVPDDRVQILRKAFDATVKDPAFLAEAEKIGAELAPTTGAEVQAVVSEVLSFPPEVMARVRTILADPTK